jgi:hypothetical protein
MPQVHQVAIATPLTVGAAAVLCTNFIHALALDAMVNFFRRDKTRAGLACSGHSRIRTYDFHRVKVQRKGPDEQSKGRNDCTLDIGIVNVRKMELIRDGDFLNDDLRDPRSISPLKIR